MAGIIVNKASGVMNSIYGKSQQPIKAIVEQSVEAFENASMLKYIYTEDTTGNFAEKYTSETSIGNFDRVGEAGAYPLTSFQEGYSQIIEPDTWKNKFEITQEMIEDAKMGKVKSKANQFTLSYGRTKENLGAAMLMGATGTSITFGNGAKQSVFNTTSADQVALFSTAHPSITGGYANQSNFFANEFSYDNMNLVEEAMQMYRDNDGGLCAVMPDTIIIPNKARIKKLVFDAIGAEGQPNTANNSFNYQYGKWTVIVWPYLNLYVPSGVTAGKDPWIMLDSKYNEAYFGAIWLDRIKMTIKSYIDENTDNNVWGGRARFMPGFNEWRAFAGCFPGLAGTTLS